MISTLPSFLQYLALGVSDAIARQHDSTTARQHVLNGENGIKNTYHYRHARQAAGGFIGDCRVSVSSFDRKNVVDRSKSLYSGTIHKSLAYCRK